MAAVWFVVSVPSKKHEAKLASAPSLKKNSRSETEFATINEGTDNPSFAEHIPASNGDLSSPLDDGASTAPAAVDFEPIETVLKNKLEELNVQNAVWNLTQNERYFQVTFSANRVNSEVILSVLSAEGIGSKPQTTLSVVPCNLYYTGGDQPVKNANDDKSESEVDNDGEKNDETDKSKNLFLQSIKARLTVAQVVEGVRSSAELTFDFIMFVLLAAMLAAVGLAEDSSVVLVASMLVSPMMGPILAGTFGTVIQDKKLQRLGLKNELIGLGLCLSSGFLFGLIYGSVDHWKDPSQFWLTNEMMSRGQLRALWAGTLIALPSGAGVALSVLGGNAGSLVGVAISASLLPPVVNGGLLWAVALIKYVRWSITLDPIHLAIPESYSPSYSNNMATEACVLGAVSVTLSIVNIICIIIMGIIVLKIKEVAPHSSIKDTKRFWQHDIRVARDYNRTVSANDRDEAFMHHLNGLSAKDGGDTVVFSNRNEIEWFLNEVEQDPVYQTVRCRSAFPSAEPKTHPTWHQGAVPPDSLVWRNQMKRIRNLHRSVSTPHDSPSNTLPYKKRSYNDGGSNVATHPAGAEPSPGRRLMRHFHFNFPNIASRFTVTPARDDPLASPRRQSKNQSKHVNELHEMIP